MQVTANLREAIVEAIRQDLARKSSKAAGMTDARHANYLGIASSVYSQLKNGKTDKVLSEGEWVRIGMELGVDMRNTGWRTAQTETYLVITSQLEMCQKAALSAVFCDEKGLGKSYAAKDYTRNNANVAYVDCSQNKTKRELIRAIARRFGFDSSGRLTDVRRDSIANILTLYRPLLILDEVGDLSYEAFLELKAIWNALEGHCGFYLMGANGLAAKMERNIRGKVVGYEELFDRMGDRFQNVTQQLTETQLAQFKRRQAEAVLSVNLPKIPRTAANEILASSTLNLRRLFIEVIKYKELQAA